MVLGKYEFRNQKAAGRGLRWCFSLKRSELLESLMCFACIQFSPPAFPRRACEQCGENLLGAQFWAPTRYLFTFLLIERLAVFLKELFSSGCLPGVSNGLKVLTNTQFSQVGIFWRTTNSSSEARLFKQGSWTIEIPVKPPNNISPIRLFFPTSRGD